MTDTAPAVINPLCIHCEHDIRDHKVTSRTICSVCDCFDGEYQKPYEIVIDPIPDPSEADTAAIQALREKLAGVTPQTDDLEPRSEMVIHPRHYNKGTIEVWDFIRDQDLNFFLGHAVKYITRAGRKSPDHYVEDLEKAINYLQKEIEDYKKERTS